MNQKISVIVPVYNTKEYLNKCLESIIRQTYTNLEIILIDDGSTDGSKTICECYEKKDKRIRFISKSNTGVSDTRNLGIKESTGEYISFIDSDDYIEPNMIEVLYKNIILYDADMSVCAYRRKNRYNHKKYIEITDNNEFMKNILRNNGPQGFLWNKLYKTAIISHNEIFLDTDIYMCEDLLFNCNYLEKASTVIYTTEPLYNYINRRNSAVNEKINDKWLTVLNAFDRMAKIFKTKTRETYDYFKAYYVLININTKSKMYLAKYNDKETEARCNKNIQKYVKQVITSKHVNMSIRYKVFCYYYFHNLINLLKKCLRQILKIVLYKEIR